jgi:hypothetical protein
MVSEGLWHHAAMTTPHVFVCWSDLKRLACDAWLVPGGKGPGATWRDALPRGWHVQALLSGFGIDDEHRAAVIAEEPGEPVAVLTNITSNRIDAPRGAAAETRSPAWYVAGAAAFMRTATAALRAAKRAPLHDRSRYLLALPLLGTKGGGGAAWSGEITSLLLPLLREEAERLEAPGEFGVDVALVLIEGPAWAAAQRRRSKEPTAWAALPHDLRDAAERLAKRARDGGLTLFLGAGLPRPAGLPDWNGLLSALATSRVSAAELPAFHELNAMDRAALIEQRLGHGETMGDATARVILDASKRFALNHALLASLPVQEIVTTNYDDLFERASAVVGRPCARIPGDAVSPGERFILKMHGCVTRPSSIVLTREDYLRFQENRGALAGIVQALLLTRHMLFVGFSFTDDNFHRIAHTVRSAIRGEGQRRRAPFGTNLVVGGGALAGELWRHDLRWVNLSSHAADFRDQARLSEIFLDYVSARAATVTTHLGDDRWAGALSVGELVLRRRLEGLAADATDAERSTPAWLEVRHLLSRLGIALPATAHDDDEGAVADDDATGQRPQ